MSKKINRKALVFKKLDSIMYHVNDLDKGIKFFQQFGMKPDKVKRDIGWCNLHMQEDDLCIDLSTKIPVNGEPHYLVDNVQEFYQACLDAGIKVVRKPFEIICGECLVIKGPGKIQLTVLDLTKWR